MSVEVCGRLIGIRESNETKVTRLPSAWRAATMAAVRPIVLSSSPLPEVLRNKTPLSKPCLTMSSSPGLPSPSKFFPPKARQLHNGGVNPSMLKDASELYQLQPKTSSKATASLREDKVLEGGAENKKRDQVFPKGRKTKVGRESDADRPKQQRARAKTSSVTKKHLADIVSAAIVVESSPAGIVKKTSSSKLKEPAQTKIKKGKVTKAIDTNEALKDGGNVKRKKAGKSLSLEEGSGSSIGAKKGQNGQNLGEDLHNISLSDVGKLPSVDTFLPLGLDEATRRRKEWTPVRDTSEEFIILDSVDPRPSDAPAAVAQNPASSHFGNLVGGYGFAQANSEVTSGPEIVRSSSGEALTKRRKLEVSGITYLGEPPLNIGPACDHFLQLVY